MLFRTNRPSHKRIQRITFAAGFLACAEFRSAGHVHTVASGVHHLCRLKFFVSTRKIPDGFSCCRKDAAYAATKAASMRMQIWVSASPRNGGVLFCTSESRRAPRDPKDAPHTCRAKIYWVHHTGSADCRPNIAARSSAFFACTCASALSRWARSALYCMADGSRSCNCLYLSASCA